MGALAGLLTIAGAIAIGLMIAWLRAEIAAAHTPFINWLIQRGVRHFPEEERLAAQAELLDMNRAMTSPTRRLLDAVVIYITAGRMGSAFKSSAKFSRATVNYFVASMGSFLISVGTILGFGVLIIKMIPDEILKKFLGVPLWPILLGMSGAIIISIIGMAWIFIKRRNIKSRN